MADAPEGGRRRRPGRGLLVGLAVLIPAIPVAIGIAIGLGGSSAAPAVTTTAGFTPVASATTPVAGATTTARSTTAGSTTATAAKAHTPALQSVPGGSGAIVAVVLKPTDLRAAPGGRTLAKLSTKTQFGSPETVWVVHRVPGWLGVVATQAGNGRVGWIPQGAASLARIPFELKVSLGARRLTVLEGGKVIRQFTVAVGRAAAPTPTGRFAVTDRLLTGNDTGPYGCCILALSAHSPHTIQGWTGGDRIAIHSTPDTTSIGEAASHGCVRVTLAQGRWLLAHVPLGTPTLISS
jgi:lipoprotein-anchoring transpeptidase ErfK/SrfK